MPCLFHPQLKERPEDRQQLIEALSRYARCEFKQAEQLLTSILPEARKTLAPDTLIISHVVMARLALARGDRPAWLRFLIELERFGQQSTDLRVQCAAWLERARVATLKGSLDVAQVALRTAQYLGDRDQSQMLRDNIFITRQRLRIAQGSYSDAVEALHVAIDRVRLHQPPCREITLQLLLAMAQDGCKCSELAMNALDRAMQLASNQGFMQCFIEEGDPLSGLLRRWPERQCNQAIDPDFVTRLLARLGILAAPLKQTSALTAREKQVLHLLAAGHRNRTIAEKMFLGECTVKTHLHKINVKLGAHSRVQAVAIARGHGWLKE